MVTDSVECLQVCCQTKAICRYIERLEMKQYIQQKENRFMLGIDVRLHNYHVSCLLDQESDFPIQGEQSSYQILIARPIINFQSVLGISLLNRGSKTSELKPSPTNLVRQIFISWQEASGTLLQRCSFKQEKYGCMLLQSTPTFQSSCLKLRL